MKKFLACLLILWGCTVNASAADASRAEAGRQAAPLPTQVGQKFVLQGSLASDGYEKTSCTVDAVCGDLVSITCGAIETTSLIFTKQGKKLSSCAGLAPASPHCHSAQEVGWTCMRPDKQQYLQQIQKYEVASCGEWGLGHYNGSLNIEFFNRRTGEVITCPHDPTCRAPHRASDESCASSCPPKDWNCPVPNEMQNLLQGGR